MYSTINRTFSPLTSLAIFGIIFIFTICSASAQDIFQRDRFGKNRVQYKQFEWQFITTRNFEIFFYEGGRKKAEKAAEFAEADYARIVDFVGFSPYNRLRLFIYNSISDLQQSNIGVSVQGYSVGGQTRFVRSEIEVPFTGNMAEFQAQINRGIADILIFEMMYGGNLKEVLQSNYLLRLPQWFMSGAARYIAEGWTVDMDDYLREMLTSKKIKKPSRLEGKDATIVGQSIWNFITQEYGSSNVASVLNLTRIVRNEKSSIQNTLGIPYKSFIDKWKDYYLQQLAVVADDYYSVDSNKKIRKNRKGVFYNKVKFSPDNRYLAFTENFNGKYKVKITEVRSGKTKTIFEGGFRLINQQSDLDVPLIGWKDAGTLVVMAPKKGKVTVWERKIEEKFFWKQPKKKVIEPLEQVEDFNVSEDGRTLIMSAERRGQSDIYLYRLGNGGIRQLTNDPYDDLTPTFMPDGKRILFASNRVSDSIAYKTPLDPDQVQDFNLFVYDPQVLTTYKKLTHEQSRITLPYVNEKGDIFYLTDERGSFQLFRITEEDSTKREQLTNYLTSIQDYDFTEYDQLAMVMLDKSADHIFFMDTFSIRPVPLTRKTVRQEKVELDKLRKLRKKQQEEERRRQQEALEKKQKEDSEKQQQERPKDTGLKEGEIDTDNYEFDTFNKDRRQSFLERFKAKVKDKLPKEGQIILTKPAPYESRFTIDNFVTTAIVDPLRGFGLLFEASLTDELENHKINAGLFGLTNLANNNMFFEYQYLKYRFDYTVRYERHNLELFDERFFLKKYNMDRLEFSASYPLNITSRFTVSPFYAHTRFTDFDLINGVGDSTIAYTGVNLEFVYDNSFVTGMNMREGSRVKIRLENFYGIDDSALSFNNFFIDARNYFRIHRNLIFASRLSYGVFFGNNPKKYALGGQSNWLFQDINTEGEGNPFPNSDSQVNSALANILFTPFIAPLRGFDLNYLFGKSHILANGEIRLPIAQYLYRGTINSTFFRHLQFTGFMDVGTAWDQGNPFTDRNSINQRTIGEGNPFTITVIDFSDPFLIGYGFGFRSTLLGHYIRFDTAWGVEDRIRRGPEFYLALGYDF